MNPTSVEYFRQALWISVKSMGGLFVFMGAFLLLFPLLVRLFPQKKEP